MCGGGGDSYGGAGMVVRVLVAVVVMVLSDSEATPQAKPGGF